MKKNIRYLFDLDNTLCITQKNDKGEWDYNNSKPIEDRINIVNKLFEDGNYIIIDTARGSSSKKNWYDLTKNQLEQFGLKYHELRSGVKYNADVFVDDKGINSEVFFSNLTKKKRIGVEINGVLRDTLKKIQQEYEKWYIDNPFKEEDDFKYEVKSELDSLDIAKHLSFPSDEDLYNFLYKENTMEIFGHAPSVEMNSINYLNDFYLSYRDNYDIIVFSDEMGRSKPASLFFLSKFGCLVEQIIFYSESTINNLWDNLDILLTANPRLLLNNPDDKKIIKFNTPYNKEISSEHMIESLKQLNTKIEEIYA